jgi:hypothetical protein
MKLSRAGLLALFLIGLSACQKPVDFPQPARQRSPVAEKKTGMAATIRGTPVPFESNPLPAEPYDSRRAYLNADWTRHSEISYTLELPSPLRIGGLSADGTVVPYLIFDGSRWSTHWPPPEYGQNTNHIVVPALESIPEAWWGGHDSVQRWWLVSEQLRNSATTTGTTQVDSLCGAQPALATDFVSSTPFEKKYGGAPWVGSVVSWQDGIKTIDVLDERSAEFAAVYRVVSELFPGKEAQVWEGRVNSNHARRAPKMTSLRASNLPDGPRLFGFRAEREIAGLGSTVITGWVRRDANKTQHVFGVEAFEKDPDGKGESRRYPELALTLGKHTFWIGMEYGYESRGYTVMEVGNGQPVALLEVDAGGC